MSEKGTTVAHVTLATAIAILRDAFPRQDFPDGSVSLYINMLSDLDGVAVAEAVRRLVRRSTWLPSIAEIRLEVAEAECHLPTASEAWSMVSVPTASLTSEVVASIPEIVKESMMAMGGRFTITHSENIDTVRAHFTRDYEDRRRNALLQAAGAVAPRELPPAVGGVLGQTDRMLVEGTTKGE